jgi:hypothetical protein
MKPHLPTDKKVFIGSVCAYGGFDWVANRELDHCCDYSLFGTQVGFLITAAAVVCRFGGLLESQGLARSEGQQANARTHTAHWRSLSSCQCFFLLLNSLLSSRSSEPHPPTHPPTQPTN